MKQPQTPTRRHRRNQLLLVGLLPSLLASAVAIFLLLTLVRNELGERSTNAGDHGTAQRYFAANRWLNVIESWIAPYNEGVASLRMGEPDAALADFLVSWQTVPLEHECLVLHNIAVTLEVIGDRVDPRRDRSALKLYRKGRAALADGRCLDRSDLSEALSAHVLAADTRLGHKIDELLRQQERQVLGGLTPQERKRLAASRADDVRGQRLDLQLIEDGAGDAGNRPGTGAGLTRDPGDRRGTRFPDDPYGVYGSQDPRDPWDADGQQGADGQGRKGGRDPRDPRDPQDRGSSPNSQGPRGSQDPQGAPHPDNQSHPSQDPPPDDESDAPEMGW